VNAGQARVRILVVDDEEGIRRGLARILERAGYECATASNAAEAHDLISQDHFSLVLCDVNMPGESGLTLMVRLAEEYVDVPVVMVTGADDPKFAMVALELGAYGYVTKPFGSNEILINVANALRRRTLEAENRAHQERLEEMVDERTASLSKALERLTDTERALRESREEAIQRLAWAAEFRDRETGLHLQRISHYSAMLASKLGFDPERCDLIRVASPMHDIGKIGIPDEILCNPGKLSEEEMGVMRTHPRIGWKILGNSESDLLRLAATIALTHHERYDGSGYPEGIAGEDIPIEGRIVAVADVFDALTSARSYKPAFSLEAAVEQMSREGSSHFDPKLLKLFLGSLDTVATIMKRYSEEQLRASAPSDPRGGQAAVRQIAS